MTNLKLILDQSKASFHQVDTEIHIAPNFPQQPLAITIYGSFDRDRLNNCNITLVSTFGFTPDTFDDEIDVDLNEKILKALLHGQYEYYVKRVKVNFLLSCQRVMLDIGNPKLVSGYICNDQRNVKRMMTKGLLNSHS